MNVLVVNTWTPYQSGGAEALATRLVAALQQQGVRADLMQVPMFPAPVENVFAAIQSAELALIGESHFGPIDRVITLKFPAYLVEHRCKVVWLLHQHRQIYDLWETPGLGFAQQRYGAEIRDSVRAADHRALARAHRRFAISENVSRRLVEHANLTSEVLYPPVPDADAFVSAPPEPFLFFPSRISPLKRHHLVIEALRHTRTAARVVCIGAADTPGAADEMLTLAMTGGVGDRFEYLGYVDDVTRRDLYARCTGVIFPPMDEDYGYVAIEAMLAAKPVLTCRDSGGVLEFIEEGVTGIVVEPEPAAMADAIDRLWSDPARGARLGRAGREKIDAAGLTWPRVVARLLE